jgi:hypothetical protein
MKENKSLCMHGDIPDDVSENLQLDPRNGERITPVTPRSRESSTAQNPVSNQNHAARSHAEREMDETEP